MLVSGRGAFCELGLGFFGWHCVVVVVVVVVVAAVAVLLRVAWNGEGSRVGVEVALMI